MKLAIGKIILDDSIYPRNQVWWMRAYQYAEAIKAGAVMPPLVVGKKDNFYVLLDGRHRLEAYKKLKRTDAPVIISKAKPSDFFAEAVRLNVVHGQSLSVQERLTAAAKLQDAGMSDTAISKIVLIPVIELRKLITDRVVRDPVTGAHKWTAKRTVMAVKDRMNNGDEQQREFTGLAATSLLMEVLMLLRRRLFDTSDPAIITLLSEVREELGKMDLGIVAKAS